MSRTADPARGADMARRYHETTSKGLEEELGPVPVDPLVLEEFQAGNSDNPTDPFKRYPDAPQIALPTGIPDLPVPALRALTGAVSGPAQPLDVTSLARLLYFSAGVSRKIVSELLGTLYTRTAPSAGNRQPNDLYVATGPVDAADGSAGIEAGLYHFAPHAFALETLRPYDVRAAIAAATQEPAVAEAPVVILITGLPLRTGWKYKERGYRHVFWDAGTILANLFGVAEASGWPAHLHLAFADDEVTSLLGVDGVGEFPVAVVRLGAPSVPSNTAAPPIETPALDLHATAVAPTPIEFPLVTATQRAGDLEQDAIEAWRRAAATVSIDNAVDGLEDETAHEDASIEQAILQRGATRMMRRQTVPRRLLDRAMAAASHPVPGDFAAPGGTLLEQYVSVHSVEGIDPGLYRLDRGVLTPVRKATADELYEEMKTVGAHLGENCAFMVFACTNLERVVSTLGARGYRAVQLEGGIAIGRLNLAVFAMGYGASPITFPDRLVTRMLGGSTACVLVTPVGVPDYKNKAGGRPGEPATLAGFDKLSDRMFETLRASLPPEPADEPADDNDGKE